MNGMMRSLLGLVGAAGLFTAAAARADIPPPDVCQTLDAVCHNAGETYDKVGVCMAAVCSKGSASGQVTMYDCMKCEASNVTGAAGAPTEPAVNTPTEQGGCSVRTLGTEKGVATVMLGLGAVALGISRRRR
jgi:hypothetical protein